MPGKYWHLVSDGERGLLRLKPCHRCLFFFFLSLSTLRSAVQLGSSSLSGSQNLNVTTVEARDFGQKGNLSCNLSNLSTMCYSPSESGFRC